MTEYSTLYEIRYNPETTLFDVFFQGAWLDKVPSYYDGQTTIDLHHAIIEAHDAAPHDVCAGHFASFVAARGMAVSLDWNNPPAVIACPICDGWAVQEVTHA